MNFKVVFVLAVAVVGCALAVPLEKEKEKEAAKPAAAPAKNDSLPLPPSGEKKEKTGRAIMDMSMPMMMNSGRPMMNSMGNMGNMNNMGMRLRRAAPEVEKKPEELPPKNDSLPTPAPTPKPKRDAEEHIKDEKKPLNETMPPKELADKDKKPLNATSPASPSKPKRDAEEAEKKPVDLSKKNETLALGAGNKTEEHKHSKRDAEEEIKKPLEGADKDKKPLNGTTPAPSPKPKRDAEEPPKEHEDKDKKPKEGAGKKPADLPKKNDTLFAAGDKTEEHKPTRSTMCDDEFGCESMSESHIRRRRSDYGSGSSQIRLAVRSRPVARAQQVRTVVRDDSYEDSEPLLIREAPVRKAVRVVAAAPTQTVRLEEDEPVLIREAAPVTVVRSAPRARVVAAAPARAVRVSSGGYDSEVVADEQVFDDDEGYGGEVRVAAAPVRARTVVRSRSSGY
ncbi:unnamed protein product [Orchesella dallaii]|uniref:Uncharacterized protein n=1 Tax=Orchesella dallaii TaxID=48710 RepID=A0ABP1RQ18_9HEXA